MSTTRSRRLRRGLAITLSGFCAEEALTTTRQLPMASGAQQGREALARLQRELFEARPAVNRFGGNVNQALVVLHSTGRAPEWLDRAVALGVCGIQRLDEVTSEIHQRLR